MFKEFIRRRRFLRDFIGKSEAGIDLKIEAIQLFAVVHKIEIEDVKIALRKLMSDSIDSEDSQVYRNSITVLNSLDEIAPYSKYPSEVRYSLAEIKRILDSSELPGKDFVLNPILENMTEHEKLKKKHHREKMTSYFFMSVRVIYCLVIFSTFIYAIVFLLMYISACGDISSSLCRDF